MKIGERKAGGGRFQKEVNGHNKAFQSIEGLSRMRLLAGVALWQP